MAVEVAGRPRERGPLSRRTAQKVHGVPDASPFACSLGIMAYNEEANIAHAIDAVLGDQHATAEIKELIVVASGCTDRTVDIVAAIARSDPRVRLIVQERREGKASAINLFISAARSPVLLMVGADVLVKEGTVDALLQHFRDPAIGMVGGHPVPVNDERTFLGHAVHLQWRLHDQVARRAPKLGEIVAFRNVVPSIPLDSAVDEISIQALTAQLGYELVYEPHAIVYNRGPTTVGDFWRQRRRIYAGHLQIRKQQGYTAPTMGVWRIVRELLRSGSFRTPRSALWTLCTVALEAFARALGYYDFIRRQPHHVWKTATTTKHHIADEASARLEQNVLVFHIADFPRQQLELGVRASKEIARAVFRRIQAALGPSGTVSAQQNGTIVAIVYGDRKKAEEAARTLLQEFATNPFQFNGHRDGTPVALACGIVAFSPVGQPLARSIPEAKADRNLAQVGAT